MRLRRPSERRSLSRSATRALDVLELFGEIRLPLRAVEIARRLSLHPSTANQLLKTMVDSGHLLFDARAKSYLPSPRLGEFARWLALSWPGGAGLRPLLREIQQATGAVVTITTANDLFMQVIDHACPPGRDPERGLGVSVFGSAIGSAWLSTIDDAEIARLADRARLPADRLPRILADVAAIRRDGFAEGPSGDVYWSVAVPLSGLQVPAVLGLAGDEATVRDDVPGHVAAIRAAIDRWRRAGARS
ncbi:MAG: helix-turn-helix domain-containing protein [Sphingomonadales bacterium]|nr:helix-turn-helix domain-containing protein [Sphingomonadales bacterium]